MLSLTYRSHTIERVRPIIFFSRFTSAVVRNVHEIITIVRVYGLSWSKNPWSVRIKFSFAISRACDRHFRFRGSTIFILNTPYCCTRVCTLFTLVPRRLYPCTHRFVYKPTVLTIDRFPPRFPQQSPSDHTSSFSRVKMLSDSRKLAPSYCCFRFLPLSYVVCRTCPLYEMSILK